MEIPVIGHLGLTPQSFNKMGGYRVQGKEVHEAERIIADAIELEKAGAFAVVLEGVPENLAKIVTEQISIPTIGIGAGKETDGQVLVFYDMLGYNEVVPKFVRKYADAKAILTNGIKDYCNDVKNGEFPSEQYTYKAKAEINRVY
jgi:3-methyl-2-oxobutanoate hydroxymethyltransferase